MSQLPVMPIVTADASTTAHAMTRSKASKANTLDGERFAEALDAASRATESKPPVHEPTSNQHAGHSGDDRVVARSVDEREVAEHSGDEETVDSTTAPEDTTSPVDETTTPAPQDPSNEDVKLAALIQSRVATSAPTVTSAHSAEATIDRVDSIDAVGGVESNSAATNSATPTAVSSGQQTDPTALRTAQTASAGSAENLDVVAATANLTAANTLSSPESPSGAPPVTSPGAPPVTSPGASPVTSPGAPPVTSPGAPPVTSPGAPPVTSPGAPPVTSPGAPPVTSPGAPVATSDASPATATTTSDPVTFAVPQEGTVTDTAPDNQAAFELNVKTPVVPTLSSSTTNVNTTAPDVTVPSIDAPDGTDLAADLSTATTTDGAESVPSAMAAKIVESASKNVIEMAVNTQNPVAAPTSAVSNVAPTASSVTSPTALAEPYRQVVEIVSPLRHRGDGDYTVTLQLQPEHLGRVEIAVTLTAGQISMQLTSDNAASRQLLKDAIDDLRQSLQSAGLETGSLDVNAGSAGDRGNNATSSGGNGRIPADYVMEETTFFSRLSTTSASTASADGALDVRI